MYNGQNIRNISLNVFKPQQKNTCAPKDLIFNEIVKNHNYSFYRKGTLPPRPEKDCLLYKERDFYIFKVKFNKNCTIPILKTPAWEEKQKCHVRKIF